MEKQKEVLRVLLNYYTKIGYKGGIAKVIFDDEFENIAEEIVKLFAIPAVSVSLPSKPFTGEMSAFLLVNTLRNLTDEQQAQLCADIYIRNSKKDFIDKRIKEMQEGNDR